MKPLVQVRTAPIWAFLFCLIGCGGSQKTDPVDREAFPTELRVAKNVATANRGQTEAAINYAQAYIDAYEDGYWERNPGEAKLTYDVTTRIELALKEHPEDHAILLTKKGGMLLVLGELAKGRSAFIDVLEKEPHPEAAKELLVSYPRSKPDEIGFICKAVTDTFPWGDGKFEFMQTCINWTGAQTPEAGLLWANELDRKWFLARRSNQSVIVGQLEQEPGKRDKPGWTIELKRVLNLNQ